jgi:hypothetical protein
MILSGSILGMLVVLLAVNTVMADTWNSTTGYGNQAPVVYELKKSFSFCQDARFYGGSVPDGFDVQSSGCINTIWAPIGSGPWPADAPLRRLHGYAFTGEQIGLLVVARDPNGVLDLVDAYFDVDETRVAKCNEVTPADLVGGWNGWSAADLVFELVEKPHALAVGNTIITAGYKPAYDKIYECILTVTDSMSGPTDIQVEVVDQSSESAFTQVEPFEFNPSVSLDVGTTDGEGLTFPAGVAGGTVYSDNQLTIKNDGSIVDIAVWLGGTDLTSSTPAKCPISNVLDVDLWMKFDCILEPGLYIEQHWQNVTNKDMTSLLGCWGMPGTQLPCFGLNPLFYDGPIPTFNVLLTGQEAKCDFKLTYPNPCVGTFDDGKIIVLMRAV